MVIEGDVLDKELPYFNGMCNVKMPIVRNMGRNLLDNNNVRVTYNTNIILRAYPTFPCKPGKRYVYCVDKLGAESACNWYSCKRDAVLVDSTKATGIIKYLGYSTSVVAPPDCKYLSVYTGGSTNLDPYSIHAYVYEVDTLAEAQAIGYTDYKENQICLTQGEIGLTQDMFEQGTTAVFASNPGKTYQWLKENSMPSFDVRRLRLKELIKIQPNTKLILQNTDNFMYAIAGYDANKLSLGTFDTSWIQNTTITIPQDVHYISFAIRKKDDTNITINDFNQTNFALLKPDKTIALRSLPNGVKDELNLLTGEYIQRVGEVVLDGSEDEGWYQVEMVEKGDYIQNNTEFLNHLRLRYGSIVSPNISVVDSKEWENPTKQGIYSGGNLGLTLLTSNLTTLDKAGWRAYLSQNPITVQYELAEPIISYPRIVSNTQEREVGVKLPNGICDTYNPSTGITVKRVGKVVLDGSENWLIDAGYTPTANLIRLSIKHPDKKLQYNNGDLVCDKLPVVQQGVVPCIYDRWNEYLYVDVTSSNIGVTFGTDDNATIISKFKTWLNANPITVYYELANPIVTTDIVLPNGVHDEYNPLTGLYTKRVGLTEFDGSDDEEWQMHSTVELTNTAMFIVSSQYHNTSSCTGMCDKFAFKLNWTVDEEGCYLDANRNFCLRVAKSKLTTVDLNGLKIYLSQNPIKVWYELATPITYQLTPYFGLPMPYAYKDGHLIMDSAYDGQSLPPEFKYQVLTNRTGQITQNNIKLKEHTDRLSNLEYILIEATLDSIFDREMQNFELELMNIELPSLDE